jgi:hypothetical protein
LRILQLSWNTEPIPFIKEEYSALFSCCDSGNLDVYKLLYKYGAGNELLYMNDGIVYLSRVFNYKAPFTLLATAVINNHADINKQTKEEQGTPLHYAIQERKIKIPSLPNDTWILASFECELRIGY